MPILREPRHEVLRALLAARYAIPAGFALTTTAFGVTYLVGTATVRLGLMLMAGLLAMVGIAVGVRAYQVPDRRPWLLTVLALALLNVGNAAWFVDAAIPGGGSAPPEWLTVPPLLLGYLCFLAASLTVVLRHTPRDASGTIDAAVWGVAVATPVWEFVFRPRLLAAHEGTARQLLVLSQVLVLFGICGALARVIRTGGPARPCLRFLLTALACTLVGTGVVNILGPVDGRQAGWPALLFGIGYLSLGAAGLHPSAVRLMDPPPRPANRAVKLQLGLFGSAMLLIPVVGGIGQLLGAPADGLLLTIAPMLTIPLVLVRIGRLNAQRVRDQHALAHQATHDELTGLVNRRRLFALMEAVIARYAGGLRGDLALIYCELNDFKPINEACGHEAGDAVLRSAARRITEAVRAGDVVARIGGDEFLIFCPDADRDTAYALRGRIAAALAEPLPWRGETLRVSAALGAALWAERRAVAPDELLAAADAEMYADKRTRKAMSA